MTTSNNKNKRVIKPKLKNQVFKEIVNDNKEKMLKFNNDLARNISIELKDGTFFDFKPMEFNHRIDITAKTEGIYVRGYDSTSTYNPRDIIFVPLDAVKQIVCRRESDASNYSGNSSDDAENCIHLR